VGSVRARSRRVPAHAQRARVPMHPTGMLRERDEAPPTGPTCSMVTSVHRPCRIRSRHGSTLVALAVNALAMDASPGRRVAFVRQSHREGLRGEGLIEATKGSVDRWNGEYLSSPFISPLSPQITPRASCICPQITPNQPNYRSSLAGERMATAACARLVLPVVGVYQHSTPRSTPCVGRADTAGDLRTRASGGVPSLTTAMDASRSLVASRCFSPGLAVVSSPTLPPQGELFRVHTSHRACFLPLSSAAHTDRGPAT
jgi:hypothetical protein